MASFLYSGFLFYLCFTQLTLFTQLHEHFFMLFLSADISRLILPARK